MENMEFTQRPKSEMPAGVRRSEYDKAIDYIIKFSDKEECCRIDTKLNEDNVVVFIHGIRSRGYTRKLKLDIRRDDDQPSVIWACVKED